MVDRAELEAWRRARAGVVTASRFGEVLAFGAKGQPLKARQDYLGQIVVERLTGEPFSMIIAQALGWGTDLEPYAVAAYEARTGLLVAPGNDLVLHPDVLGVGATPDGLVGEDGGFECKCPASSIVHLRTILEGMPVEHVPQVQGGMWVTGRRWWDFVSYDPRMPERMRLHVQRIERDERYIARLEEAVLAFLAEVGDWLTRLERRAA